MSNKPDCNGCPYAGNILMMRPPECPDAYEKAAPMCGIYPHKEDRQTLRNNKIQN